MKNIYRKLLGAASVLCKILPFFIGLYCYIPFYSETDNVYPVADAVYSSIKLYSGSTEGEIPLTTPIEIARFLALATMLSILLNALNKITNFTNWFKLKFMKPVAIYGDSAYADYVWKSLDKYRRIRNGEKLEKGASQYLLMYSDNSRSLKFYNKYYSYLKDRNVYIMLDNISRQNIENKKLTVFSAVENCARQYWRNNPVEKSERIAFIGFGDVGESILLYGLQMNIIDPAQHFEYHIFGNAEEFAREHTELDKMDPDEIVFHSDRKYEYSELTDFDRIIVCASSCEGGIIAEISKILTAVSITQKIYAYAPNGDIITNFFGRDRLICFGAAKETASIDIILNEKTMQAARAQHEYYQKKYGGETWEQLDSFKRYSNVSSSDYLFTIERLKKKGVSLEILAELEHIRWCRYHYLNNWKYGEKRDNDKRTHPALVPFSKLSREEILKDIEAIKSKLENLNKGNR